VTRLPLKVGRLMLLIHDKLALSGAARHPTCRLLARTEGSASLIARTLRCRGRSGARDALQQQKERPTDWHMSDLGRNSGAP
jgi:hypothetical protein